MLTAEEVVAIDELTGAVVDADGAAVVAAAGTTGEGDLTVVLPEPTTGERGRTEGEATLPES